MPAEPVTKNFAQLSDAAPLSDGDFLAVNQPDVFNNITQQQGATRKITVEAFSDYVIRKHQKMFVGFAVDFLGKVKPSPYQLAKMQIIELTGQILPIAQYQTLCEIMWVGTEANNLSTTYFWYKCNADGTRNVNGLYMKFADWRGVFPRIAGVNGTLRTDMNNPNSPPYDGKNTGDFLGHKTAKHYHTVTGEYGEVGSVLPSDLDNSIYSIPIGGNTINRRAVTSQVGDNETAGASISQARYIVYAA